MNEHGSRRRRGDKWFAVGRSQVKVQSGGALYVHAVGGSEHQLRDPANAAQAAIMMSEAKRINKQYGQALSREYLKDPTLLMQLYLALVSLLVKWGQFQPSLFIATVKSRSTHYYGQERHLLHSGMVQHKIKPSVTLLPADAEYAWQVLFAQSQEEGGMGGSGDGDVSSNSGAQSSGPQQAEAAAPDASSTSERTREGETLLTEESTRLQAELRQAQQQQLPPSPRSLDNMFSSFTDMELNPDNDNPDNDNPDIRRDTHFSSLKQVRSWDGVPIVFKLRLWVELSENTKTNCARTESQWVSSLR